MASRSLKRKAAPARTGADLFSLQHQSTNRLRIAPANPSRLVPSNATPDGSGIVEYLFAERAETLLMECAPALNVCKTFASADLLAANRIPATTQQTNRIKPSEVHRYEGGPESSGYVSPWRVTSILEKLFVNHPLQYTPGAANEVDRVNTSIAPNLRCST
jgi:hypothetical protein